MKKSSIVLALAGLATLANAQEFSLSITGAPSSIDTTSGATFTVDVVGDADVGTHMLGGSLGLISTGFNVENIVWTPASWSSFNTDGGYAGGGIYNQVIFGQLVIPGLPPFDVPAVGSELGHAIGSFQVQIGPTFVGFASLELVAMDPFSLQVLDIATGEVFDNRTGNLTLNGAEFWLPTPSSLALLGFGGLAASRRRR